ncbi:MAG: cytochrome c biogenesis protein CcsA [Flavobacteriales bacterium]|nr:cytochrome c biogenesis protein CcsA [Flavobacteriales bacterium]
MKHWWKFLGIGLLLFASIAALRVPLAPALVHVSPDRIAPGPVELLITGYNTHFTEPGALEVWLENGQGKWCASNVTALDDTHLRIDLDAPGGLTENLSTLATFSGKDGLLRLPEALWTEGTGNGDVAAEASCVPGNTRSGHLFVFPNRSILYESIRNLCFHVPMWFTMIVLMAVSMYKSIRVLGSNSLAQDLAAELAVKVGLVFCFLGLITGAVWARATWGAFWTNDVKLNGAAVTGLIYLAYLVLRGSVQDAHKRARLAAIYNIFAFVLLVLFLFVVPRLNAVDSLHPGNGGNSGFSDLDLDSRLRMVFYPAVLGWILLGTWMYDLRVRAARVAETLDR